MSYDEKTGSVHTGNGMFYLSTVLGALINTLVIGWCALALRRGTTRERHSDGG
ncbi:SCO4225 family membrane protein [Streptomyces cellulosae]